MKPELSNWFVTPRKTFILIEEFGSMDATVSFVTLDFILGHES